MKSYGATANDDSREKQINFVFLEKREDIFNIKMP